MPKRLIFDHFAFLLAIKNTDLLSCDFAIFVTNGSAVILGKIGNVVGVRATLDSGAALPYGKRGNEYKCIEIW